MIKRVTGCAAAGVLCAGLVAAAAPTAASAKTPPCHGPQATVVGAKDNDDPDGCGGTDTCRAETESNCER